jgi:alpha-glucosidase
VEKTAKMALERRYRLLPYLYTLFEEASRNGMPVMRPVFMADAKDLSLRAEDQAFLLGGDLLVVPGFAREAKLPRGNWPVVSLIPGDREDKCQAELRIRPGAIVPLGKVIQNTIEKSLDPLTLLVCLDGNGTAEGTLYEDAGEGFDYRAGDFCRTTFRAGRKDGKVVVTVAGTEGRRQSDCPKFAVQIVE